MVFKKRVSDELRAYIKFKKRTPVAELVRETGVSRPQIYRILKEPLQKVKKKVNKRMGRTKKLSERDKRTILRQIRLLRREDGNWTIKRLMESSNVTHVSQRTVTRLLHQNGYKYLQARKKGLLSEKDKKDRVKFARKMLKNHDKDVWKNDIAFYLDGVSFAYKRNPQDQAKVPKGRIWRKESEGLTQGCTSKGSKCGTGANTVKFLVSISYGRGVICCKRYEKMNGNFFASFVQENFDCLMARSGKNSRMWIQDANVDSDPSQNSTVVKRALCTLNCPLLLIPPHSPDMNPIENIFNIIRKRIEWEAMKKRISKETNGEFEKKSQRNVHVAFAGYYGPYHCIYELKNETGYTCNRRAFEVLSLNRKNIFFMSSRCNYV